MPTPAAASPSFAPPPATDNIMPDPRPRILCLHGGGTTGAIFNAQCRSLIRGLPHFRLVFANAPFPSEPGPGVLPAYEAWGPPFFSWLFWKPGHPQLDDVAAARAIVSCLDKTKADDDARGGCGPWVALLGFSQGAKIAVSLLMDQQVQRENELVGNGKTNDGADGSELDHYRFGVLVAGRGPLVGLSEHTWGHPALVGLGDLRGLQRFERPLPRNINPDSEHHDVLLLRVPTIHLHGLLDEGLEWNRKLARQYCDERSTAVVEWSGPHRVPLRTEDVARLAAEVYRLARQCGVILN
ncbi:Esterase LovG [Madurella mycetomatis]|uniref:Esterase LovG n=1 Tax=Madurella mycetomatis TaxID=100816 RepID=A0A175W4J1_9PEZI|nr:Esterase LovG [Madurella mycetomatis]